MGEIIMGLHSKCSLAYQCAWGSRTVPGTCGFSSCQRSKLMNEAKTRGNLTAAQVLKDNGAIKDYGIAPNGTTIFYD